MATFVVIVGPIASGKSSVAEALGASFRERGRAVAVLDLDDVVATVGGFAGLSLDRFRQAQVAFGELVGAWLRLDVDVIAHGPFLDREEDEALVRCLPCGVEPRRVLLRTSYETAQERVAADPTRTLSKHPEILRRAYDRAERLLALLPDSEWTFDTATRNCREIVNELTAALVGG